MWYLGNKVELRVAMYCRSVVNRFKVNGDGGLRIGSVFGGNGVVERFQSIDVFSGSVVDG